MSQQQGRPRPMGRARGRDPAVVAGGQGRPGAARGPAPGLTHQPPPAPAVPGGGAWRGGGGGDVGAGRASARPAQPSAAAGVVQKMAALSVGGNGNGNGNGDESTVGRAALRGRRVLGSSEVLKTRPETCVSKSGSFGAAVSLTCNYFQIETPTSWTLYQYRVDFKIDEDRPHVLKCWMKDVRTKLGLTGYLFDGSVLFTPQRLSAGKEVIQTETVRKHDNAVVLIELKLVGDVRSTDIHGLQVWGILLRRCLGHLKLELVGRNFFDPAAKVAMTEHRLELWPGYVTSIRQHDLGLLLCSEITHKVMRTDTVFNLLQDCIDRNQRDYQRLFQQVVVGQTVLTDYNNKTYRVDDVDFTKTPSSTFPKRDGSQMSFVEYYATKYNIRLRDAKQPLLVSKAKARDVRAGRDANILLIPELCRMTGITEEMKANFHFTKALSKETRVSPSGRIQRLRNFRGRLQSTPAVVQELKDWQFNVSQDLVKIPGRVLPRETIICGAEKRFKPDKDFDWTKDLRSVPMLVSAPVKQWVFIIPKRMAREGQAFVQTLMRASAGMNFNLPPPRVIETNDDKGGTLYEAVDRAVAQFNPDFILFGVSNNRADRYAALKKKCIVDRGIISQVVTGKSMNHKSVMSLATKIAIQINAKLGGAPWTTEIPLNGLMVVGYDVCHEPGAKGKSVGAMVASLNKPLSRWFSSTCQHSSGEELSNSIALELAKALRQYSSNNNCLPSRIVFYRDGVGEGQLHHVYHHEVETIKAKLTELYGGATWKMAYIIVTKRINTRIFQNGANPEPGTIVDDAITNPEKYDFFLISQTVREGTVAPTSYNVISDNVGLDPDQLQRLTYKMTHLYYNWSGTVRVPAPCQYAHKLAFLVSQHVHGTPHPNLQNYLYFL